MKKRLFTILLLFIAIIASATKPKYVFYFIGDGMGPSHILGTELLIGETEGIIGRPKPMCFTQFPYTAFVTTFSASNGVTDSAASGTALATGHKTNNGYIGMLPDGTIVNSIAALSKEAGYAVGISTTVPINHATPSAFYAHQRSRNNYNEIAIELLSSDYDFFAGGDPVYTESERKELYEKYNKKGYTITRGFEDFGKKNKTAEKIILFQKEVATQIPYTIDRTEEDLTLAQITEAGIEFLDKKSDKGFFFMIEGGKIDYASHSDDAATMMHEVSDFNSAIEKALEFYYKHPDETLIIVTADHETGGIVLGFKSSYTLNLKALSKQKVSADRMGELLIVADRETPLTWDKMLEMLSTNMGLEIDKAEKWHVERLQNSFNDAISTEDKAKRENGIKRIANHAKDIIAHSAAVSWASGNHSGTFVPLFAIGAGSENFKGVIDNTDIPKIIKRVAEY